MLRLFAAHGPMERKELERRLAGMSRGAVHRRLAAAEQAGIISHERSRGLPPRACFALRETEPHYELAYAASIEWEVEWGLGGESRDGVGAMRTAAHTLWVPVIAALADGPLSLPQLQRQVDAPHATLWRYLSRLVADGLLERVEGSDGAIEYAAPERVRRLAVVPVIAVSIEWSLGRVTDPAYASNLHDLVHALAPLATVDQDLDGDCHLHVDSRECRHPDIYVRVDGGRLLPLSLPPRAPQVVAHATPAAWCEALLHRRPAAAHSVGCHRLFAALLDALSTALIPADVARRLREARSRPQKC